MASTAAAPLADVITARLVEALAPTALAVTNESHLHSGHAGDNGTGETHFRVEVESPAFQGQSRVARQRMINRALADLLAGPIHALAIRARTPGEP